MVYTLTVNPALDYTMNLCENLKSGKTNRSLNESYTFGGKGLNVSYILNELDTDNTALGFYGGFAGEEIINLISKAGIKNDFIRLNNGTSRINVKLKGDEETEINGSGPEVDGNAISKLFQKIDTLKDGDALILSGSISKGMSAQFYAEILEKCKNKSILTVVDATGKLLTNTLSYNPFLIKPNRDEIEELFGKDISIDEGAHRLIEMGALNVLVSLGKDGAKLYTQNGKKFTLKAPDGNAVNTVGAGDSMVAGFVAEYLKTSDISSSFIYGVASGSATAFSYSLAKKEEIIKLADILKEDIHFE
ncbi:MAG: 1-phosphofructokinase [Clostridia bacterium]|nr:1-phosphofructokinase [Clostridia bacterium]